MQNGPDCRGERVLALRECVIEPVTTTNSSMMPPPPVASLNAEAATHFSYIFAIKPCRSALPGPSLVVSLSSIPPVRSIVVSR
jgi:hypothetical protein